uniref:bactericidal permeability-increasing protein-like n=1 Tax=Ciona intestinalis TaxID=7719 RepID=UPI000EF512BE|nr:bactericidal permeability-increasing protein-like [Ciona intestinalis]|eukprot:XP_026695190.1 bactericidal permeability-increasing protein-like [Ciona intestinalis]
MNDFGQPTVKTKSCSATISSISLRVHGGPSWLYNLILKVMKGKVKRSVNKQICPAIIKAINKQTEKALSELKVTIPLLGNVMVNASLTEAPSITSQSMVLLTSGRCIPKNNSDIRFPFSPTEISVLPGTDQMTDVVIGEYFFRTFGYSLWSEKTLDIWVTNMVNEELKDMKANMLISLILSDGSPFKFKNRPLQFEANVTRPPHFHIRTENFEATIDMDLYVYVILKDQTKRLEMILQMVTEVTAKLSVNNTKFTATVSGLTANIIKAKKSFVGKIAVPIANHELHKMSRSKVIPAINRRLQQGYALPTFTGVSYENPRLQLIEVK